jgi:uncharacterized protein (TIGR02453 family)
MSGFEGFSAGTLGFLADLAEHNDRTWFAENRERYESELLGRQRAFLGAIGERFAGIDPRVRCEPTVDRSIYRINRDTRFTRDKSPYKTYADLWFWIGADRKCSPGYFVRIVPSEVWIGGGMHLMSDEQLAAYRTAVGDASRGAELDRVLTAVRTAGYEVGDETRKRMPPGFSADHPRAALLRHTRLHALRRVGPPPAELFEEAFVDWCLERFAPVSGLVDWLASEL